MALLPRKPVVGTTAVELTPSDMSDAQLGDCSISVQPPLGTDVYIGPDSGVTVATGHRIVGGTEPAYDLHMGERVFGVIATGSVIIPVLLTGA